MTTGTRRNWIPLLVVIGFGATVSAGFWWLDQAGEKRREAVALGRASEEAKEKAARSVATLPKGVEAAWLAYADRMLLERVHVRAASIEVETPRKAWSGRTTFVSTNTPYSVECDPLLGIQVSFSPGGEERGIDAQIVGPGSIYDSTVTKQDDSLPPLPVDRQSIAAEQLFKALCARIANRLGEAIKATK